MLWTRQLNRCATLLAAAATLWLTSTAVADELPVLGPEVQLAQPSLTTRGGAQNEPDIACTDDGRCLVVWIDSFRSRSRNDVMGAFMAADGRVGTPFLVAAARDYYLLGPAVATDGRDFVVTWSDYDEIRAVRVDSDGLLGAELVIASGLDYFESEIAATRNGRFLVVWEASVGRGFDTVISGAYVEPDDVVSSEFVLSDPADVTGRDQFYASVASDGTRFLVTWIRRRPYVEGEPNGGEVRGVLVEADGQIGEQFALGVNDGPWWPASVVADGDGFLAAWNTPRTQGDAFADIVVARVEVDGTVTPSAPVLTRRAGVQRIMPSLDSDAQGQVLLTWAQGQDERAYQGTLRSAARQTDGTWSGERVLKPWQRPINAPPAIAHRADRHVVVWGEDVGFQDDLLALDVDASGEPLDDAPRLVASGPAQHAPHVVALDGDERFLVIWGEGGQPGVSTAVVGADGQVLDHGAVTTHTINPYCLRAAGDGERVLVTWPADEADASEPSQVGVWRDGDGHPGTKLALPVEVEGGVCLPVATDGAHFLVTWLEWVDGTPYGHQVLRGALVAPDAPTAKPFTIATLPVGVFVHNLTVSGAPDAGFLVGWWTIEHTNPDSPGPDDRLDVYAVRVDAMGSVGAHLPVATGADDQLLDDIVASDAGFTIFWHEREGRGVPRAPQRAMATRVGFDGVVHEPRVVAESDAGTPGFNEAFARDGERVVAVWQAGGRDDPWLGAAVWDGERPPVMLDTDPATAVDRDVQIAWGRDRGLVVYTRDYLVYARSIGVEAPEPLEPGDDDVSDVSDAADDTSAPIDSAMPTPGLGEDASETVAKGCCSAVRTDAHGSGAVPWWTLLGLLALVGTARRRLTGRR